MTKLLKTIANSEFDFVSQNAHVCGGALAVFIPVALHCPLWWVYSILMMVYAGIKEFYYDQRYEDPETRGSNARDFVMYGVGVAWGHGAVLSPAIFFHGIPVTVILSIVAMVYLAKLCKKLFPNPPVAQ